jgi:hypothetical protein
MEEPERGPCAEFVNKSRTHNAEFCADAWPKHVAGGPYRSRDVPALRKPSRQSDLRASIDRR